MEKEKVLAIIESRESVPECYLEKTEALKRFKRLVEEYVEKMTNESWYTAMGAYTEAHQAGASQNELFNILKEAM